MCMRPDICGGPNSVKSNQIRSVLSTYVVTVFQVSTTQSLSKNQSKLIPAIVGYGGSGIYDGVDPLGEHGQAWTGRTDVHG